ncbi:hypothetical protein A5717_26300 [Mycolicibacterium porcinum]|uniref:hypothetical protein n=1 Tax=Mycolicibacterium porcinum TaxID=39693 RepID=UPI00081D71A0|nr:hypothetical protein [Mycolicibacterium porcinum]OCB09286.1 hypothetical protein A5717_26300 [Mycolicibacterium porcinum]
MSSVDDAMDAGRRQFEQDEAVRRRGLGPSVSDLIGPPAPGVLGAGGAPGRLFGVIPPPEPTGPYTVWMDNGLDGWRPEDCDTLADCFHAMHAIGHSGDYRITRDVEVEIREARP